jgi:hypothetical protein
MNAAIPQEVTESLSPNEGIRFVYSSLAVVYYFTDSRIVIETNYGIERASKSGSLFDILMGFIVKPKKYTSLYYSKIEAPELIKFGISIHLIGGGVEAIQLRSHEDARRIYEFICDKINESQERAKMPPIIKKYGIYAPNNSGTQINTINGTVNVDNFSSETLKAIAQIREMSELQMAQKECLVNIMQDAETAIKKDNESEKKSCKDRFNAFIVGTGVADKVLSVLANLATVASFFGIGIPK